MTTESFPQGTGAAQRATHPRKEIMTTKYRAISKGQVADLPINDVQRLCPPFSGWVNAGLVGTSEERPTNTGQHDTEPRLVEGLRYIDTTLGKQLIFDGGHWCDVLTGEPAYGISPL